MTDPALVRRGTRRLALLTAFGVIHMGTQPVVWAMLDWLVG